MHSTDGEKWSGRYRFAREDTGLIQVMGSDGEVLNGTFERVARTTFVKSYEQTFGRGSIAIEAPDSSAYGETPLTVSLGVLARVQTLLMERLSIARTVIQKLR